MMVHETTILGTILMVLKYIALFLIPFVEPQLSGILGGVAYLIVRHELNMASMSLWSIIIVMFFGWIGAWASVNLMAEHCASCPYVWVQIVSATAGFLSYDAMMILGANTSSVIGFFFGTAKDVFLAKVEKWKR